MRALSNTAEQAKISGCISFLSEMLAGVLADRAASRTDRSREYCSTLVDRAVNVDH